MKMRAIGNALKRSLTGVRDFFAVNVRWRKQDRQNVERDAKSASVYISQVVEPLQGWLYPYTAIRSCDLLDWQVANEVPGALLEIGVYAGKYLSVLMRSAHQRGDPVVGVDTFEFTSQDYVRGLLQKRGVPEVDLTFVQKKSVDVSADDLKELLPGGVRFASVDGSHEKNDVAHDLRLCESALGDKGIIAADDFLNCLTMGVGEAVIDFLRETQDRIVPFGYVPNKLLMCRPKMAEIYSSVLLDFAQRNPFNDMGKTFADRGLTQTRLVSSPVVVLS